MYRYFMVSVTKIDTALILGVFDATKLLVGVRGRYSNHNSDIKRERISGTRALDEDPVLLNMDTHHALASTAYNQCVQVLRDDDRILRSLLTVAPCSPRPWSVTMMRKSDEMKQKCWHMAY